MGKILPAFKKSRIDDIKNQISSNSSYYYVFAANPVEYTGNTPATTNDDYSTLFYNDWSLLFGKKVTNNDIMPVIRKIVWESNTIYSMYDNTSNSMYTEDYYVVKSPSIVGGDYLIYKCLDNANGSTSTQPPDQIQSTSFRKSDGYLWRYITSISDAQYKKFATNDYVPIYANATIVSGATNYNGIEVVMIENEGSGYNTYNDGDVQTVVNSTLIQIESTASTDNNFYTKNAIYIYNEASATSQLKVVSSYVSNSSGNWVYLDSAANTTNITPSITKYKISPRVVFDTDGIAVPSAYSVINTVSNSISNVVIIDTGYGISRANVSIISNSSFGTGANLYAIVPPPGGHGSNPEIEMNILGYCISVSFSNTESNTISSDILYNKIGILKNPYTLNANNTKGSLYTSNTFSSLLKANVSSNAVFDVGDTVIGQTSNALGIVAFSNSTVVHLVGDKKFSNSETVVSSNGAVSTTLSINTLGNIYTKDLIPIYIKNVSNIERSNTQTETFKIVIQI